MKPIQLAGCIITNDAGDVLLLHRLANGYDHWEIPGGKIEPGETAQAAAIRELHEELGIIVGVIRELGHAQFTDRNRLFEYHYFQAVTEQQPTVREPEVFSECAYQSIASFADLSLSRGAERVLTLLKEGQGTL